MQSSQESKIFCIFLNWIIQFDLFINIFKIFNS